MSLDIVTFKSAPIEIIDGDRGKNYPKQDKFTDEGYCLFLNAKNITENGFNFDTKMFISEEKDNLLRKGKLQKGDVILTTRGTVGNVAFYSEHIPYNNIRINSGMLILRSKQELDNEFLYWTLKSNYFKKQIYTFQSGTAQPQLPISSLKHIEFYLPPINIQKKIVKILSQIDNKIRILKYINKNLEQLMKCIFDDWFVNFNYSENILFKSSELGEIPSNWNVKNLGEVLITLESGKRPKGGISDIDDGIPSIGAENILGLGKFDYSKNKLISYDFFNQMKKGIIHNQDVLLYKDGAQLGRKSLFMNKFPFDVCCINEHVFRLQSNDEISQFYLYLWLDQPIITNEIINLNSNSAQPGINQTDVKSLPILVPDFEIMTKFENIISPMMNQIFDNALEINKLSKLRDILLPKLMSGEINVSKINCDLIIVTFYFYFEILFN